jgi:hypothetical protein
MINKSINNFIIPVYKEIMVMKYGKIDSTSNINNRINQIKRDYSAITPNSLKNGTNSNKI